MTTDQQTTHFNTLLIYFRMYFRELQEGRTADAEATKELINLSIENVYLDGGLGFSKRLENNLTK